MVQRRNHRPPHRPGTGRDPAPGLLRLERIDVNPGLAEGGRVGSVGGRSAAVVGFQLNFNTLEKASLMGLYKR